jgi:hypothetical protein
LFLSPNPEAALIISQEAYAMEGERREKPRHESHGQTFVVLRPNFVTVGKLVDISTKGLAFNYMALDGDEIGATHVDIFRSDHDFYLASVRCKIIYEKKENEALYFESRRCGVQFGELSHEQIVRLENYLRGLGTGTP